MVDWLGLTRFVHIGGSVLLAAIFAFRRVVLNPAIASVRGGKYTASLGSCFDRLAFWGWMTVVCSGFVWFGLVAASVAGEDSLLAIRPETLELILFRTQFGQLWLFRFGCSLVLGVLFFSRSSGSIHGLFAMVILASLAGAGHAGAHSSIAGLPALAGDIGHLVAAALWPGGLVPLILFLRTETRAADAEDWSLVADVIRRFSNTSLVVVAFLAGTGILNACFMVRSPEALFVTGYGQLLLLKISLFFLMLGFAGWNLLVLKPCVIRLASVHKKPNLPEPIALLVRNVVCETVLAAFVLLVVGFLGVTPPPVH
ncbi:MAG: CopD family protein [Verrucomicrobia bacterium]|nr:CopD family protein [Verrucomicrobiota bacterium]